MNILLNDVIVYIKINQSKLPLKGGNTILFPTERGNIKIFIKNIEYFKDTFQDVYTYLECLSDIECDMYSALRYRNDDLQVYFETDYTPNTKVSIGSRVYDTYIRCLFDAIDLASSLHMESSSFIDHVYHYLVYLNTNLDSMEITNAKMILRDGIIRLSYKNPSNTVFISDDILRLNIKCTCQHNVHYTIHSNNIPNHIKYCHHHNENRVELPFTKTIIKGSDYEIHTDNQYTLRIISIQYDKLTVSAKINGYRVQSTSPNSELFHRMVNYIYRYDEADMKLAGYILLHKRVKNITYGKTQKK